MTTDPTPTLQGPQAAILSPTHIDALMDVAGWEIEDKLIPLVADLVRKSVDAALAEIEQHIQAQPWFVFDDEDVDPGALTILRAYRKEISR